ncbi:MAG: hypothetical protein RIS86_830 [Planctomycetota bacterium]|jgi:hypothetical protein
MTAPAAPVRPDQSRADAARLLAILARTEAAYRRILAGIHARRAALRAADFTRFAGLGNDESRLAAEIAELDRARLAESRQLATRLALAPDATLGEIAERLVEADRARLDAARASLKELVLVVRKESSVVRQAAERLSAHMAGILQSVHSALAQANVYSRGGRIAVGANVISSLDIRS